jgi:hypothetical protein
MTYPLTQHPVSGSRQGPSLFRQCRDCGVICPLAEFVVNKRSSRRCPDCQKKRKFESWTSRRKYTTCKACGDPKLFVTPSGRQSIYCGQHYVSCTIPPRYRRESPPVRKFEAWASRRKSS